MIRIIRNLPKLPVIIFQFFVQGNVQVMHLLWCSFAVDVIIPQVALEDLVFLRLM